MAVVIGDIGVLKYLDYWSYIGMSLLSLACEGGMALFAEEIKI